MTITSINFWTPHPPCSPIDEPRTIILFPEGSSKHFSVVHFKTITKFELFTFYASYWLNGNTTSWGGNLDFVADLVRPSSGDFFKFEHDAYTNGLNVLSICTFQIVPRAMELVESYLVCLNSIGSSTTTKKIINSLFCMHT
jgi:hypothetical protein